MQDKKFILHIVPLAILLILFSLYAIFVVYKDVVPSEKIKSLILRDGGGGFHIMDGARYLFLLSVFSTAFG